MIFLNKNHRDIVFYKALCNLRSEASKTYLSILWWVIEPIFLMGIYYVVFGLIFENRTENFTIFLLVGLVIWQWFSQCISHCAASIDGNRALICQVNFPKIILPSINIVMDCFKFSIVFTLLLIALWFSGYPPNTNYCYLPLLLLIVFFLNYACGILAAAAVPYIPDLANLIPHLLRVGFYGSGILYSIDQISPELQKYLMFNPMIWIIDSFRKVLMYDTAPETIMLINYSIGVTLLFVTALITIEKLNARFARVLIQK